jgi:hypothetical protein
MDWIKEWAKEDAHRILLEDLKSNLRAALGDQLEALLVHGGESLPGHPRFGDLALLVVVTEFDTRRMRSAAPALLEAARSLNLLFLVATREEIRRSGDVFPIRFQSMRDRHVVLLGEDPFDGVEIHDQHLRLRIEQELRNLQLKLRRRFLECHVDQTALVAALADAARPLLLILRAMLRIHGENPKTNTGAIEVAALAAQRFGLDPATLKTLARIREQIPADVSQFYSKVLRLVQAACSIADQWEVKP